MQSLPCPRNSDIEQPALLIDCRFGRRVADRNEAFLQPDEVNGVPLEALRGVQRREGHGSHGRLVLSGGALDQLRDKLRETRVLRLVFRKQHEGVQRLPTASHGAAGLWWILCPAERAQHVTHGLKQLLGRLDDRRALQHHERLLDLGQVEEPWPPAQLVADPRVAQRSLERGGLGIDAIQDGDVLWLRPGGELLGDTACDGARFRGVARVGAHGWCLDTRRCIRGRRSQHQRPRPTPHKPVCGVDDRGNRPVVAFQPHDGRIRVPSREAEQELRARPGERVDGLARVPDDAQVLPVTEPQLKEALLQG